MRLRRSSRPQAMYNTYELHITRGAAFVTNPINMSVLRIVRTYFDWFVDLVFGLFWGRRRQSIAKAADPLVLQSATSLAKKIRKRELTSQQVVRAYIDRIVQVNEVLNAVTDDCFQEALEEAKKIDRKIANDEYTQQDLEKLPFLGVPFTTKESTICRGLKCTFGLVCRKDVVGQEDAAVVAAMKGAGAILLGVTNIPQLNMWQETHNPVYGTTNNPYDTTRTVGGSSGGEAAIIAACGSPLGIGTDIGGSIRIPAYMCGIFGHKPTNDLISTKGLTFRTGTEGPTIVTAGTMTRYVEDIVPFLKVLLGNKSDRLNLDKPVNVKSLKIYYFFECGDPKMSPLSDDMRALIKKVVEHFTDNTPQQLKLPDLKYGGKLWNYTIAKEGYCNFKRDLTDRKGEVSSLTEMVKFLFRRSEYNLAVMFNLINLTLPLPNSDWAEALIDKLKKEITSKLGSDGVLLYPSYQWSARYHHTAIFRPWNFYYWAVWNVFKLPVTQVPLGLDQEGLPVGIQVIAGPHQDRLCIAVARKLEAAFGGYVPPFE